MTLLQGCHLLTVHSGTSAEHLCMYACYCSAVAADAHTPAFRGLASCRESLSSERCPARASVPQSRLTWPHGCYLLYSPQGRCHPPLIPGSLSFPCGVRDLTPPLPSWSVQLCPACCLFLTSSPVVPLSPPERVSDVQVYVLLMVASLQ